MKEKKNLAKIKSKSNDNEKFCVCVLSVLVCGNGNKY